MRELKNVVKLTLIDEIIEALEQIKYEQRLLIDEQINKLIFIRQDIKKGRIE